MQQNTHGYVTELDYVGNYYDFQSPVLLNYIAGLNGMNPPDNLQNFDYCELGCGKGVTLNLLADANPDSHFIGIDFNESHIQAARQQAEDCDIKNVRYFPYSFDQLDQKDLPEFDYIVLHGVYSWISPELRGHIVNFIRRKLKPGGVVMVSYNALPGKALDKILRDMMLTYANTQDVSLLEKTSHGISYLDYLAQHKAPFFQQNPKAIDKVALLKKQDMRYVAHEYFGEHWNPLYFSDVYKEMQTAGMQFAGQTEIMANYANLAFPSGFQDQFNQSSDRISLEIHRDFILNNGFRRDVYIKPHTSTGQQDLSLDQLLQRFAFVSLVSPDKFNFDIKTVSSVMKLHGDIYKQLVDLLYGQAQSLNQLMQHPAMQPHTVEQVADALQKLLIGNEMRIALKPTTNQSEGRLSLLNQQKLRKMNGGQIWLSSPVLGAAVAVNELDMLLFKASQEFSGDDAARNVVDQLHKRGKKLVDENGNAIDSDESRKKYVAELLEQTRRHFIPCLQGLRVIE
ncbi:class I SAM-dependent methyltransferase [Methylomarinum vadi]|uniref:class I SAM-dependent methyltransferase n=1 Tax=Methylomarinum vadi TaxID=438855 RepID=UPI00069177FE|nr:class I SAM-dependent methyltransferase [Methylomarinum vadi]